MTGNYDVGAIVWVRLGQKWWPGRVTSIDECPSEYTTEMKKKPFAVVKFFNESGIHEVTKSEHITSYNCSRKHDLIKKGLNAVKLEPSLGEKFEADIATAEKLTGGDIDIIEQLRHRISEAPKRRIDYSDMGFGSPPPRKAPREDRVVQRDGASDIREAIQYKPNINAYRDVDQLHLDHQVFIREQPPREITCGASSWFKCVECGFTCSRLHVMMWHYKAHYKHVTDYDSGIRVPGRRRRRRRRRIRPAEQVQGEATEEKPTAEHSQTNGHGVPTQNASDLLADWAEEELDSEAEQPKKNTAENAKVNGVAEGDDWSEGEDWSDGEVAERTPAPSQPPPRPQVDINSAFDALLAESSPLQAHERTRSSKAAKYVRNEDSDSDDCSDWEKYMTSPAPNQKPPQRENGFDASPKEEKNKEIKEKEKDEKLEEEEETKELKDTPVEEEANPASVSSSGSSGSGPAYMLVAVDAAGNNVPMPVLSEGGSHLVAVEASMEDGTTRTLYIDPAHLGPNVDLNNLMLHIDNSGQETVIIPTSTADGETSISSLIDSSEAPPRDATASSPSTGKTTTTTATKTITAASVAETVDAAVKQVSTSNPTSPSPPTSPPSLPPSTPDSSEELPSIKPIEDNLNEKDKELLKDFSNEETEIEDKELEAPVGPDKVLKLPESRSEEGKPSGDC